MNANFQIKKSRAALPKPHGKIKDTGIPIFNQTRAVRCTPIKNTPGTNDA